MLFLNLKILFVSLGVSLVFHGKSMPFSNGGDGNPDCQFSSAESNNQLKTAKSIGYKAVTNYDDGFVAAGSEGRIDWIADSGKTFRSEKIPGENFNCLISQDNDVVVAGDNGVMYISSDKETFRKKNSGTDKNINSLALFRGKIIAGTDDGEIVSVDETGSFSKTHLAVNGNIVSVSAGNADCFGVTDRGEIIHSTDGTNWDIFDFNQVYEGFYKPCSFTSILVTEKGIAVAGINKDGSPVFMLSTLGQVWSDRPLVYNDEQGIQELLTDQPTGIFYDDTHDLFYLVCNAGKLMKLPSCSHCNELVQVPTKNLSGISGMNEMLMIVGEDFYIKTLTY